MASDPVTARKEREREREIKDTMLTCRHFTGIHRDSCCKAGIDYRALVGGPDLGWAVRLPCLVTSLTKGDAVVYCPKRDPFTLEEAKAKVAAADEAVERSMRAFRKVHDDAKAKGYGRNHGGMNQCRCPICEGTIRYSVAATNGHIWAKCETANCVSFME